MLLVMYGRRAFSRVFEITESSEIGRNLILIINNNNNLNLNNVPVL